MLIAERYEKIIQAVNEKGSIRVTELSTIFEVTEETIRRDLDRLEHDGKLRRSHGGAVSIKETQYETSFSEREIAFSHEKRAIAQEAVKSIKPHDRIILDASTSAWYMASYIPDIPLTVLTNSIKVATELANKERVEVISTGGILSARSLSYVGPMTEKILDDYHVDKLFMSCKGVHMERGISDSNELQARVKQKMICMADEVFLLADSSKFGNQAFTLITGIENINSVITNRGVPTELLESLNNRGIITKVV